MLEPFDVCVRNTPRGDQAMIDLIYVFGTIAFFALMLAYVRGCELLGRTASTDAEHAGADRQ